jgi:hypothetical protein
LGGEWRLGERMLDHDHDHMGHNVGMAMFFPVRVPCNKQSLATRCRNTGGVNPLGSGNGHRREAQDASNDEASQLIAVVTWSVTDVPNLACWIWGIAPQTESFVWQFGNWIPRIAIREG